MNEATYRIIKTLHFSQIRDREFAILDAHQTTFEGVFDNKTTNFSTWCRSYGGIYWISGKAGSGKSTLMKFLLSHQKTKDLLCDWAGQKQLVTASHFFWSQGTKEQRSQTGLFQTLLSQILAQCPRLISFLSKLRRESSLPPKTPWSLSELFECFSALSSAPLPNIRICLFVDGLDEYDGDHRELTGILQTLSHSTGIKICASSRPWVEFISAFGDVNWKLAVHDLTREDILTYVSDNLNSHERFEDLSLQHGTQTEELMQEIISKAQGVFLWVYLVVRSLLRGLGNKDVLQDLRMRLDEFPEDLERYFGLMMDSIEAIYRQRTAKVFRVLLQAESEVPVITFHFMDEEEINPDYALGVVRLDVANSPEELKSHQLTAQCRDLIHITKYRYQDDPLCNYGVGFLHRTVADYFKTSTLDAMLRERSGRDFDPRLSLCRSSLAQFKSITAAVDMPNPLHSDYLALRIVHLALQTELVSNRAEKKILDSLHTASREFFWRDTGSKLSGDKSLLQFATRCGLSLYVRETVLAAEERLTEALYAALSKPLWINGTELFSREFDELSVKLTRELLEAGASPNSIIVQNEKATTPWRHLIALVKSEGRRPMYGSGNSTSILYSMCHLLLSNGATAEDGDWAIFKKIFTVDHCGGQDTHVSLRKMAFFFPVPVLLPHN